MTLQAWRFSMQVIKQDRLDNILLSVSPHSPHFGPTEKADVILYMVRQRAFGTKQRPCPQRISQLQNA